MATNDDFEELVISLQVYLEKERSTARGSKIDRVSSNSFREKVTQKLPELVTKFPNVPDIIFVRNLISFAVNGLEDKTSAVLWNNYYKRGDTLLEISKELDISTRTVKRFIDQFAEKIVVFWWESLTQEQQPEQKLPLQQRMAKILEDEYGVTTRQAEILSVFCLYRNLTRVEIQENILVISENTLKTHISRIVKTLDVKSLKLAINKVLPCLKKQLGDDLKL